MYTEALNRPVGIESDCTKEWGKTCTRNARDFFPRRKALDSNHQQNERKKKKNEPWQKIKKENRLVDNAEKNVDCTSRLLWHWKVWIKKGGLYIRRHYECLCVQVEGEIALRCHSLARRTRTQRDNTRTHKHNKLWILKEGGRTDRTKRIDGVLVGSPLLFSATNEKGWKN